VQKLPKRFKAVTVLEIVLGWGVAVALFAMMTLTFCDVIGRKFVGSSIPGVVEVSELLMLAVIFIGLPLCSLKSEHVIFDLLDKLLPKFLNSYQHLIAQFISASLVAGAAWLVWNRAVRTLEQGDITAQLLIPMGPFYFAAAVLLATTAIIHFALALQGPEQVGESDEVKAGAL
jgi:TRAP-type transport system small permease protein